MRNALVDQARHYEMVTRAIEFIRQHARRQPSLNDIAEHIGLSEFHLQRIFTQWAGISPKRFLQFVTKEYAKQALRRSEDLLATSLASGLSGPGRLHDLMVSCEAMSPGEIKTCGAGLHIRFGIAPTPFGHALIAWTPRGICHLGFVDDAGTEPAVACLKQDWPAAAFSKDQHHAEQLAADMFKPHGAAQPLHLLLRGTNFQLKVWEALIAIAPGEVVSYTQLGQRMGMPDARRSIGTAIGKNRIAVLIPCHRVIRDSGDISGYRWGAERKVALLAREGVQAEHAKRGESFSTDSRVGANAVDKDRG